MTDTVHLHWNNQNRSAVVRRHGDHAVIGWITYLDCENAQCKKRIAEGACYHATARGFATTLPDNHFNNADDAAVALHEAAQRDPEGLQRAIEISAAIAAENK